MHPAIIQTAAVERSRDMQSRAVARQQAAELRRAAQARRSRPFIRIARAVCGSAALRAPRPLRDPRAA